MNCEHAIELIIASFVEPLSAADRESLDDHLVSCKSCSAAFVEYDELWQHLDEVAVPERLPGGLERLQRAMAMEFEITKPGILSRSRWIRVAAALMFVAIGGLLTVGLQSLFESKEQRNEPGYAGERFLFVMTETTEAPELSEQANAEIQAWFRDLIDQGVLEIDTAIGIGDAIGTPEEGPLLDGPIAGMVVIRANDKQHAQQIAQGSPMKKYGGSIEIRAVE